MNPGVQHVALLAAVACTSCESYEPPCTVSPTVQVLDEAPQPGTFSTLTSFSSHESTVVVSWLTFARSEDGTQVPKPRRGHVAVFGEDGTLSQRHTYELFPDLDEGDVPEDNVGFCWTPAGAVVHWTRDTTLSAVGEPPSIRTGLRLRRITPAGVVEPAFAPVNMHCDDCVVVVAATCHRDSATILLTAWSEDEDEPRPLHALAWNLAADRISSGPVEWLDRASLWPAPVLRVEHDALVLLTTGRAWVVDAELGLRGGPVPLPASPNRKLHWSADGFESTVAWSTAPATPDGEAPSDHVLIRRYDGYGRPVMPVARLGASAWVASMVRAGSEVGLVLRDGEHDAFAWARDDGTRVGGDVPLGRSFVASGGSTGVGEVLRAPGDGRFLHLVGQPGRVERREIVCDP